MHNFVRLQAALAGTTHMSARQPDELDMQGGWRVEEWGLPGIWERHCGP